jgi:hypothetical protein
VAVLARSEWSSAKGRRALVHENARFAGEVRLTKRPEWVRPAIASPRYWFSLFVWSSEPRAAGQGPFLRFADPVKARLRPDAAYGTQNLKVFLCRYEWSTAVSTLSSY